MSLKVIDTHAHYDDDAFDEDRYALLSNMLSDSVHSVITIGTSLERSRVSIDISEKFEKVYAAVGIHPEECENLPDDYIEQLEKMTENKKVVAIGEIGLDYHYDGFDKTAQISCFEKQLSLAEKLRLPVIIHTRDATQDTMEILKKFKPRGVMHCYSGSAETAREILDLGMMISFTGVLTFKNAKKAIEACKVIPMDRLMLETDCPYMAPVPYRGKRNNSSYVRYIAEKVAEIKGLTTDEVIEICNSNAISFFKLEK